VDKHPNFKYGARPVGLATKDCGVIFGFPKDAMNAFRSK